MKSTHEVNTISHSILIFLVILPFGVLSYLSFILNPVNRGDLLVYILQLIADLISIWVIMGLWVTILIDIWYKGGDSRMHKPQMNTWKRYPSVDVLIPVAGEDLSIIKQTVIAAQDMDYPHNVFILDDKKSDQVKQLAQELGVYYIRRKVNEYAKSGNINHALMYSRADFIAVLDADFVAEKHFLTDLLLWFEDPEIAFVQSPQYYSNTDNFIARGTAGSQDIFYRYVLPARNSSNSVFCVGTNVIFRRKALDTIGGIALMDHSEDIWTSLLLHQNGWKSIFVNTVLAQGQAPETIRAFFKQQKRWAQGGFSVLLDGNPLQHTKLSFDQKIQYLFTTTFYLIGFAILIYMTLPLLALFFGLAPIEPADPQLWLVRFIPYFCLVYIIPLLIIRRFHTSIIGTSLVSFYPYIQGFFAALTRGKYIWVPTSSTQSSRQQDAILAYIWPHICILILSLISLIMAWTTSQESIINVTINSIWVLINMFFILEFLICAEYRIPIHSKQHMMSRFN